jgi:hypothetical protein
MADSGDQGANDRLIPLRRRSGVNGYRPAGTLLSLAENALEAIRRDPPAVKRAVWFLGELELRLRDRQERVRARGDWQGRRPGAKKAKVPS